LFAMVRMRNGRRVFLPPATDDVQAALSLRDIDVPDTELPEKALGFRVQGYGIRRFADLFLPRQLRAAIIFSELVSAVHSDVFEDARRAGLRSDSTPLEDGGSGARAYADAVTSSLRLCDGRSAASNDVSV